MKIEWVKFHEWKKAVESSQSKLLEYMVKNGNGKK